MLGRSLRILLRSALVSLTLGSHALALPAQDVRPVNNREYFPAALDVIDGARDRVRVILFLAQRYERYPDSPTNRLLEALARARKRGVDVQVILERPSSNKARDKDLSEKNNSAARWLRQAGVTVHEDSPETTTHSKVLTVDGMHTIVGSTNWTFAAMDRNNEAAVLIRSAPIAEVYEQYFDRIAPGGNTR